MKRFLRAIAILLVPLLASCAGQTPRPVVNQPTPLLLVSIDAYRADYLARGLSPTLQSLADTGVRFWDDVRWAEDWPFDLMLLNHCTRLYFLDTVFTHYRVGRQGSLLTDAKNLPKRFDALAAAQRHLAAQAALGKIRPEVYAVMLDAAADVFWPQARTAAVKDTALRKACLPGLRRLRPLYPHGTEVQTRKDWKLFQTMMKTIGPRLTLWMASRR